MTRREAMGALGAAALGVGGVAMVGCAAEPAPAASEGSKMGSAAVSGRLPVVFLPHGGGPWPFVELGFGDKAELDELAAYLRGLNGLPKEKPKAVLAVSAHWEEAVPTVMTGKSPPLYFDYYGFPPESYQLTWPAPGSPELAGRVRSLLEGAGFQTAENGERGFDHGTFVPLKLTYPEADVPVIQVSLIRGLDPAKHLAMGRALAPLRDEGVFIVGSGMSYHNLRAFGAAGRGPAKVFDDWLREVMAKEPGARDDGLARWASAPAARQAHPREEHLIPLMVCAGAAGGDVATNPYNGSILGLKLSAFHFG